MMLELLSNFKSTCENVINSLKVGTNNSIHQNYDSEPSSSFSLNSSMMIQISGIIIKGESSASGKKMNWKGYGSIYHQVNFFKENNPSFFKKIINCQMATINIELKDELILSNWEYIFDKVYWLPNSNTWYEKLSFTPIVFLYNQKQVHAWLYKAHKSPHNHNDFLIEVIAPYIADLTTGNICEIKINETYFK